MTAGGPRPQGEGIKGGRAAGTAAEAAAARSEGAGETSGHKIP
jgi:hypothetical protein